MDKKISQLDPAAALDGTELLAVVQGGSTLKTPVSTVKTYLDGYYVPLARTLTINGTAYDLTANRTWNIDTLPAQAGNNGKFLTTDGSTASWGTITQPVWGSITGTLSNQTDLITYVDNNLFKKGGNTFGSNAELGTNDAYQLAFRTNGTARINISSTGETGIMVAPSTDARLTIGNGNTTRASLRLMSGSLLTSPISGAIENDGTNLYYTDNTPTRYALLTTATGVTGSGTTNYVSKWTSSSALGDSLIYDNGTNVGIGTSSPSYKLDVNGTIRGTNVIVGNPSSPVAGLHVYGGVNGYGNVTLESTSNHKWEFAVGNSTFQINSSPAPNALFYWDYTNNWYPFTLYNGKIMMGGLFGGVPSANAAVHIQTNSGDTLYIKGSTSAAGAYALKVDNSSNSALLYVRNDKFVGIGISAPTTTGGLFQVTQTSYDEIARFQGYFGGAFNAVVISKDGNLIAEQFSQFKQSVSLGGTLNGTAKLLYAPNDWSIEFGNTTINNDSTNSFSVWKSGYNKAAIRDSVGANIVSFHMVSGLPKIAIGTTTPDSSAIADFTSTTQGVLMPRMTTTQRNAISTPANGLEIYNTSTTSPNYYDGTTWQQVTNKAYVDTNIVSAQVPARLFNYYNFI